MIPENLIINPPQDNMRSFRRRALEERRIRFRCSSMQEGIHKNLGISSGGIDSVLKMQSQSGVPAVDKRGKASHAKSTPEEDKTAIHDVDILSLCKQLLSRLLIISFRTQLDVK
jgi:hypothetical protein